MVTNIRLWIYPQSFVSWRARDEEAVVSVQIALSQMVRYTFAAARSHKLTPPVKMASSMKLSRQQVHKGLPQVVEVGRWQNLAPERLSHRREALHHHYPKRLWHLRPCFRS